MIAWLAAGIDGALLLILEKFDQFRHDGFFNAKSFLTGMIDRVRRIARNGWRTSLVEVLLERSEPGRLGHL